LFKYNLQEHLAGANVFSAVRQAWQSALPDTRFPYNVTGIRHALASLP